VRSKEQAHYYFQLDQKMGTVVVVQQEKSLDDDKRNSTLKLENTRGIGAAESYGQTGFLTT